MTLRVSRCLLHTCVSLCLTLPSFAAFDPATGTISDERWRTGVPLGGVGCGAVELLTDGALGNATLNHNWDRPTGILRGAFAAVQVRSGGRAVARVLRRPLTNEYAGVTNVKETRYLGLYPRAEVRYSDPDLPVTVGLHAWSPLVPRNLKDSSLPVAYFEFTLTNPTADAAEATIAMSWENLLGFGGRRGVEWDMRGGNEQRPATCGSWEGLTFATTQQYDDMRQNTVGEYFLAAEAGEGVAVSACPSWDTEAPEVGFWEGFVERGELAPPAAEAEPAAGRAAGAVAARVTLAPGETKSLRFLLVWHMPTFRMEREARRETGGFVTREELGREAFDRDLTSRWSTERGQRAGDQFTLDLGAARVVGGLALDASPSPNDYPRGYVLETSPTGVTWTEAARATRAEAEKAQRKAVLDIRFAPRQARFLRVTIQGDDDSWFWSIHELRVRGPGGVLDLSGARATDRRVEVTTTKQLDDVGHYFQNAFPDVGAIAEYAGRERERLLAETRAWQQPVLDSSLPFWLKLKLLNCAFTMYSTTVLTRDGRFAVMESPIDMGGALGTMDQRMAAHAFYTQLFPELDKSELRLFAQCQQADGRITHFIGNFHEVLGDARVGYGITDWPDLSASWLLQVLKEYRWSGDRAFLEEMWPHIQRAIAWLDSADHDGDLIPEGGSTYDYETLPRGAFIYNASCYLGALLGAEEAARVMGDEAGAEKHRARFRAVQKAVLARLWNGRYFRKWRAGQGDEQNPNSFIAALAGDWLAHLCGLEDTLPRDILDRQTEQLIARHLNPFFPVPPMEVTDEGRSATGACFMLQHEPYLGCEAIYRGFTDAGLETIRRVYHCAWEQNKSPWDQSLVYNAPGGQQGGLRTYMTCPTTWHVLNALSGITLDVPDETLYISPRLPSDTRELHLPMYLGDLWLWLDYAPDQEVLSLRVLRSYREEPLRFRAIRRDGNTPAIALPEEFVAAPGATLDLSGFLPRVAPYPRSRQVAWMVKPGPAARPGLSAAGWKLTAMSTGKGGENADLQAAVDGDPGTRWATAQPMRSGDWFRVDLGALMGISGVRVDIAASRNDYPRGYEVLVSRDGLAWDVVAQGDGKTAQRSIRHGVWRVGFSPVKARHVKIVQTGWDSFYWWSIHELYVMPEGWRDPVSTGKTYAQKKRDAR